MIVLKSSQEIDCMKRGGQILAEIFSRIQETVRPGISTKALDTIAVDLINSSKVKSAFLGYRGFPSTICTSINEELVHGIPGKRKLAEGDIISIDIGILSEGYYVDKAVTVPVGEISQEADSLLSVTREALSKGVEKSVDGNRLSDVSGAIQRLVEEHGFSVVRDYVGHGIGRQLHEDPQIPNFVPLPNDTRLKAGMVLALEPMVNKGGYKVKVLSDGWTVVTKDKSLSAHFEDTVAITEHGPEVLTQ